MRLFNEYVILTFCFPFQTISEYSEQLQNFRTISEYNCYGQFSKPEWGHVSHQQVLKFDNHRFQFSNKSRCFYYYDLLRDVISFFIIPIIFTISINYYVVKGLDNVYFSFQM